MVVPIGVLLVFKSALLQFKPSIDEKYNQIKKTKKTRKIIEKTRKYCRRSKFVRRKYYNNRIWQWIKRKKISDILRKHKLYN